MKAISLKGSNAHAMGRIFFLPVLRDDGFFAGGGAAGSSSASAVSRPGSSSTSSDVSGTSSGCSIVGKLTSPSATCTNGFDSLALAGLVGFRNLPDLRNEACVEKVPWPMTESQRFKSALGDRLKTYRS